MWVQLLKVRQVERNGVPTMYQIGDWVEIGKHDALMWIADGAAVVGPRAQHALMPNCGVCAIGNEIPYQVMGLPITCKSIPTITHPKTLVLAPPGKLKLGFVPLGFYHLAKFDVCVPLWDLRTMASEIGMADDQARTKAVLPDLRVPIYDTRLLWIRDSVEGRTFISAWNAEPGERRLAFLRTLFTHPLKILALPPMWGGR